ncbi:MAG TPA: hypothetical protein VK129_04480 [Terriglobales bacterium]|nr:hypothetical protein [Terriglobales bacterium]
MAIIAIMMVLRGLHRRLPFFFSYATFVVLSQIPLVVMRNRYPQSYEAGYWIQDFISWGLGFLVAYEIYASLLNEYPALQKLGTYLFWVMGIVLVIIALWAAFQEPGSDKSRLVDAMYRLERSVRIVEVGLLLALFVFASFFGLSWKNYLYGIALGFAIFLSMQLAVVAIRAYFESKLEELLAVLQLVSYNLGVWVWTYYVTKRWRAEDLRLLPKTQLAEWNETLQELLHR